MLWLDECNDNIIKSCGRLSKSLSSSDITRLIATKSFDANKTRYAVSELALNSACESARLSRSCSTWVAVGELASTSQLPSPHGCHGTSLTMNSSQQQLSSSNLMGVTTYQPFTTTDLINKFNKKVRDTYIRSRLRGTNRAIERLSQSEFSLDQLATIAVGPGPTELVVPAMTSNKPIIEGTSDSPEQKNDSTLCLQKKFTICDIEKERGRPLSKYDKNMLIFNWLHSLDETATFEDSN